MFSKVNTKSFGRLGENYALNLLQRSGYKILEKNFRCPLGEIDAIAHEGDFIVFVEVKTRRSTKFGLPQEAVDRKKISKIIKVGEYFCLMHPNLPKKKRIDVVSIVINKGKVIRANIIKAI